MSCQALKKIGLNLPVLPTTSVGSFPKPDWLAQARIGQRKDKITTQELEGLEKKATKFWIEKQEELGIDVLVDGEQYRGDMVAYFADYFDGFEEGQLVRSYGNRYYRKPIITGEVRWKKPITVDWWKFAQGLTDKPVKGMLTGPYTIMDWCFNEHYPSRRDVTLALAHELRKEVEELVKAGAKIIQIDEPATSVRPQELDVAVEALTVVTRGFPDTYFISHMCYGNFHQVYPGILKYPVQNLDLEMSNSDFDLLPLFEKNPFTKDISLGVVDVHSHAVEEEKVVASRLNKALKVFQPEQVWVDPDCGLKTREVDQALAKLSAVVQGAREVRKKL